jgi:glycogen debranching enzyme
VTLAGYTSPVEYTSERISTLVPEGFMVVPPIEQQLSTPEHVQVQRWPWSIEHTSDLDQPFVTAGNRVYSIATQNGEFPDIGWRQPGEMSGVWDHPIKLLDGFWFGISFGQGELVGADEKVYWLTQASRWRITPGEIEITYRLPKLEVIRREYGVDDEEGMLIQLRLRNQHKKKLSLVFHFLARTDLRTAWLGENRLTWRDGRDEAVYLDKQACIAAYNTVNPAYVLFGALGRPSAVAIGNDLWATKQTGGQGISGYLRYQVELPVESSEEVICIIAGSTRSSDAAVATYQRLQAAPRELAERQRQVYRKVMERCALESDDELADTAFGWAKATLQMLERKVPGIGHGLAAGLPDYPWWFGKDTTYTTLPLVASGQFELALTSLRNLARYSQSINNNGAVVHEILTQGHVHDNGHLVEVLLFVRACYHAYMWTGDREFLQEMYAFCKHGLLDLVLGARNLDGSLCATGKGLVETRELQSGDGFKTLDIASYTYEALLCLAELAYAAGDDTIVPELKQKAQQLQSYVNATWWMPGEGVFGDILTSAKALSDSHKMLRAEKPLWSGDLIELELSDLLLEQFAEEHRFDEKAQEQERPWLLKHMIGVIPMETGLATNEHAERAFTRLESGEFSGPWGIYLNPERQRVTMTLPSGLMAVAEARYGRMDQSLALCHKIAATLTYSMPGAFSEISPDAGCFIQAWSSYGIIWPVVHHFLGFRPDAAARKVRFIPHLPTSWKTARLHDVRVGSTSMHLEVEETEAEARVILETGDPLYQVTLGFTCLPIREPRHVSLNGKPVAHWLNPVDGRPKENEHSTWRVVEISPVRGQHRYEFRVAW